MRLADIFHIFVRLTVSHCCAIATVTVMAGKIARITDIGSKRCGAADSGHLIMDAPNSCNILKQFYWQIYKNTFLKMPRI